MDFQCLKKLSISEIQTCLDSLEKKWSKNENAVIPKDEKTIFITYNRNENWSESLNDSDSIPAKFHITPFNGPTTFVKWWFLHALYIEWNFYCFHVTALLHQIGTLECETPCINGDISKEEEDETWVKERYEWLNDPLLFLILQIG